MENQNQSLVGKFCGQSISYMRRFLFDVLSVGPIPNHIAFILDGNRRYARKYKLGEGMGHRAGFLSLMSLMKYCYELGIKYITIYAFSIDNFRRKPREVKYVMDLMLEKIEGMLKEESIVDQYGVRVYFIGNLKLLNDTVRNAAEKAMKVTAKNNRSILLICVAYTSTDEIAHAAQGSCEQLQDEIKTLKPGALVGKISEIIEDKGGHLVKDSVEKLGEMGKDSLGLITKKEIRPKAQGENLVEDSVEKLGEMGKDSLGLITKKEILPKAQGENPVKDSVEKLGEMGKETLGLFTKKEILPNASEEKQEDLSNAKKEELLQNASEEKQEEMSNGKKEGVNKDLIQEKMEGILEVAGEGLKQVIPIIKLSDIETNMYMGVAPDVDILVRSSGETRLSNFLLWQTWNGLLYSPKALWPEVGLTHLVWAILNFQRAYPFFERRKKQF